MPKKQHNNNNVYCDLARAYSNYVFFARDGRNLSAGAFHSAVEKEIHHWEQCFKNRTIRSCAYDVEITGTDNLVSEN